MTKQVSKGVVEQVSVAENSPQTTQNTKTKNLFVKVDTIDTSGKLIGTRIVDMYHFGTRGWLHQHQWWAMHNNHVVDIRTADEDEVGAYLAAQKQALADRFNNDKAHTAAG